MHLSVGTSDSSLITQVSLCVASSLSVAASQRLRVEFRCGRISEIFAIRCCFLHSIDDGQILTDHAFGILFSCSHNSTFGLTKHELVGGLLKTVSLEEPGGVVLGIFTGSSVRIFLTLHDLELGLLEPEAGVV